MGGFSDPDGGRGNPRGPGRVGEVPLWCEVEKPSPETKRKVPKNGWFPIGISWISRGKPPIFRGVLLLLSGRGYSSFTLTGNYIFLWGIWRWNIFFIFFSRLMYPLFAVMSKGTDAYPRARQGSLGHPWGSCHEEVPLAAAVATEVRQQLDFLETQAPSRWFEDFLDFPLVEFERICFVGVCGELPKKDAVFSSIRFFAMWNLYGCKAVILCLDFSCVIFKDCLEQWKMFGVNGVWLRW